MKNKIITIVGIITLILAFIASIMSAEYRYIMHNIKPYIGENNTVYLEVFGHIDEYYADFVENM